MPKRQPGSDNSVTPYVGVWIETLCDGKRLAECVVTPYVGVWIETMLMRIQGKILPSHPTWVCGLKLAAPICNIQRQ